jgi:hypothetical protein
MYNNLVGTQILFIMLQVGQIIPLLLVKAYQMKNQYYDFVDYCSLQEDVQVVT